MTKPQRYRQEALGEILGAKPREYSPSQQQLAPPKQGQLALDGAVLGPLFDQPTTESK